MFSHPFTVLAGFLEIHSRILVLFLKYKLTNQIKRPTVNTMHRAQLDQENYSVSTALKYKHRGGDAPINLDLAISATRSSLLLYIIFLIDYQRLQRGFFLIFLLLLHHWGHKPGNIKIHNHQYLKKRHLKNAYWKSSFG